MKTLVYLIAMLLLQLPMMAQKRTDLAAKVDSYLQPYVESNNFSGTVLIAKKGEILFQKAYGFANLEWNAPNQLNTIYHIASVSKTFTAAAILILEQKGLLSTNDLVSTYIPDYPSGGTITIHHLLSHTSGITNVNNLPEYAAASYEHQTPESLISLFKNKPLEFQPGEKYQYSNSNYNLLALIIENISGKKYGAFLAENIFVPLKMISTFHDDDATQIIVNNAEGYAPDTKFGLQKAPYLDWSSKTGNGSLATTVHDLYLWDRALYGNEILSAASKTKMFTQYAGSGYGWYLGKRFEKDCIYMNGRSPGFSSHISRYPEEEICVIVLENNYVSAATSIGFDLAGLVLNQPIEQLELKLSKAGKGEYEEIIGQYKFAQDFYQPNFLMSVSEKDGFLFTDWGILIPGRPLHFIQRAYWSKVSFEKGVGGKISKMHFDNFTGNKIDPK